MKEFMSIAGALSDPHRVRALMALHAGELCACQIIELLGLAPSTVSKHMSILKQAGLVSSRKEERWIYYRLPDESERSATVQCSLDFAQTILESDSIVANDSRSLKRIKRENPSTLCKTQRERV